MPTRDRNAARSQRCASREKGALSPAVQTSAEADSAGESTKKHYRAAHDDLVQWDKTRGTPQLAKLLAAALDELLVTFIDAELYRKGLDAAAAEHVIFGTIYRRSLPNGAQSLPRCRRALAGFSRGQRCWRSGC